MNYKTFKLQYYFEPFLNIKAKSNTYLASGKSTVFKGDIISNAHAIFSLDNPSLLAHSFQARLIFLKKM